MENFFTGNKDADREILLRVKDNKELLTLCSSSKYGKDLCNSDFFRNYLMKNYPNIYEKSENIKNWKNWYLLNIHFIGKLEEEFNAIYSAKSNVLPKYLYDYFKIIIQKYHIKVSSISYLYLAEQLLMNLEDINLIPDIVDYLIKNMQVKKSRLLNNRLEIDLALSLDDKFSEVGSENRKETFKIIFAILKYIKIYKEEINYEILKKKLISLLRQVQERFPDIAEELEEYIDIIKTI